MAVYVVVLENGDAFDVEIGEGGEWNEVKVAIRGSTFGFLSAKKWRKNNNPPNPTCGPFTEDNPLVIPVQQVLYMAVNGLEF